MPHRLLLFAAALPLAACQSVGGDFPSLLPRAIESRDDSVAPRPAPSPTAEAATLARITTLLADGERALTAFDAALAEVDTAVSRAGPAGSDSWVAAQVALGRLDTPRGIATASIVALDELFAAELAAGRIPPRDAETGKEALAGRIAARAATLDALRRRLAPA